MTRINSNLNPAVLKKAHLIAEWREITMVPASLKRSLNTKTPKAVLKSIPRQFTLNSGHVKFFYDKLGFLKQRFTQIADEMERRGYFPDRSRIIAFDGFDDIWYNNWESTANDDAIVIERINLRISQKPHLYVDTPLEI